MDQDTYNLVNGLNSILPCPFCSGSCHVTFKGINPVLFGVQCRNCGASIPARHAQYKDAVRAWNPRSGLAAMGGRATRGIRSRRKLAAARRNLKKARQVRQINRLRQGIEAAYTALKPYRQREFAMAEAALAQERAELKILEPKIMSDPLLRQIYTELILQQEVHADAESPDHPE